MPTSNTIVAKIARFRRMGPKTKSLRVHFANKEIATLEESHPDFDYCRELLEESHRVGLHVYASLKPGEQTIRSLLLPVPGIVRGLLRDEEGGLSLHLDNSSRLYKLGARDRKLRSLQRLLQQAQLDNVMVLVTENEAGEIVDMRRWEEPAPQIALTLPPTSSRTVSRARATELFSLVASHSCDPANPSSTCIPFLYPDNGCHDRASEMCKLIIAAGEEPVKIWNYALNHHELLTVRTGNAPGCEVKWVFHVAVGMQVAVPGSDTPEFLVLDPSLFPQPVSAEQWRLKQGVPASVLAVTAPEPYLPPVPAHTVTDPGDHRTNRGLAMYRLKLKRRAGQIPFHCPKQKKAVDR